MTTAGASAGEIFGAQRRHAPVGAVGAVREVVAAKPFHRGARQEIAFGVLAARGKARVLCCIREISDDVGDGIDQQLRRQLDAGVAAGDRGGGREIAAGAVAGDADAAVIAAELGDAGDDVPGRGEGILERAGKAHLGRAAIIDGDDDGAGLDREPARLPVMGVEIAGDPAAAVEEHAPSATSRLTFR